MGMQGHAQTGVTDTITKGEHEWACKGMHRQRWACTQRVTHTQLRDDAITLLHSSPPKRNSSRIQWTTKAWKRSGAVCTREG